MGSLIDFPGREAEKQGLEPDPDLLTLCEALREYVDHANQAPDLVLRNGVMQPNPVKKGLIQSIEYDGVEVGYRLVEHETTVTREIFIRFEQSVGSIPDSQRDPIMMAIFDAFLMEGQGPVDFETFKFGDARVRNKGNHDCVKITQTFAPLVLQKTDGPGIRIDDDVDRLLRGNN